MPAPCSSRCKDWSQREAKAQDLAGKFMGIGMMQPDGMGARLQPAAYPWARHRRRL
jgi:hypothetical protein